MKGTLGHIVSLLEKGERNRREGYRALLRALHTVTGMLVLGIVLLVIPVLTFAAANLQQETANNVVIGIDNGGMVIEVFGSDGSVVIAEEDNFGSEEDEAWSAAKELLRKQAERERKTRSAIMIVCAVCGVGCLGYSFILWKKKKKTAAEITNVGTVSEETSSIKRETGENLPMPVENPAGKSDRRENLKRLYEAGILSKDEYEEMKKKR